MKKNRLRAATMIAAMTIVFGFAQSEAQETVLRIGVNLTTSDADPFYAQDIGLFRRAGLNVTIQSLSGGAAIASAVASGDLDIGVSNMLSLGNAVARGIPIKAIAPGYLYDTNVPLSRVVVAPNGPIHTAKDLNGKVVCGLSVGGMDQLGITPGSTRTAGIQRRSATSKSPAVRSPMRWTPDGSRVARSASRTAATACPRAGCDRSGKPTTPSRRAS